MSNLKTFAFLSALFATGCLFAQDSFDKMICKDSPASRPNPFVLADEAKTSEILVSAQDFPAVIRAAKDLGQDFMRVTGTAGNIIESEQIKDKTIVVGTIGKSSLIDSLISAGKLDVSPIKGKWESFLIQTVGSNLVIAGSDKRGTIYGIYEISERIGVDPWYWWADVPCVSAKKLLVESGRYVQGPPKVKFRGIFINDENPSFADWSNANYGGINSKMYAHMFELILRLRGNYLWPAMWGKAFNEDDPLNPVVADEYGVVMGTSHHEPLMRNQQEWTKRSRQLGEWNYRKNGENMRKFWLEGLKRNAKYDNLPTVGLRGDGDEPLDPKSNFESNKELLYTLFKDQRELIREAYGRDPSTVPQTWVVFNEIWTFFNRGVMPPDDVIITFSDSNFGYLLQLPTEEERKHPGGLGLYYHIDMNGGPWNDRWISTREIPQMWYQLALAYEYGIRSLWIVNVGDLKPKELEIDFFLKYAWDPDRIKYDEISRYMESWAKRSFPAEFAKEITELVSGYIQLNHIRKPELQKTNIWSAVNYDETARVAEIWQNLADRAEKLKSKIPARYADAYYQLVYYPVVAGAGTAKLYLAMTNADTFAKQGRASAAVWQSKAQKLLEEDKKLSDFYNSKNMANGKWNKMMSDIHIGYTQWSMPRANALPRISRMPVPAVSPSMGVAVEGNEKAAPHQVNSLALPDFDSMNDQSWTVSIFNRSDKGSFDFELKSEQPWIKFERSQGTVNDADDEVLKVSIDWTKLPNGTANGQFLIQSKGENAASIPVAVKAVKADMPVASGFYGGLTGPIVIPASGYNASEEGANGTSWHRIDGMGRWDGAMVVIPVKTPAILPPEKAPQLEYNVFIAQPGEVTVDVEILPIFPENPTSGVLNIRTLRLGTSFDNDEILITDTLSQSFKRLNNEVFENVRKVRVKHTVKEAGIHTFKVSMVDPAVSVERIVVYPERVRKSYLGAPMSKKFLIK